MKNGPLADGQLVASLLASQLVICTEAVDHMYRVDYVTLDFNPKDDKDSKTPPGSTIMMLVSSSKKRLVEKSLDQMCQV